MQLQRLRSRIEPARMASCIYDSAFATHVGEGCIPYTPVLTILTTARVAWLASGTLQAKEGIYEGVQAEVVRRQQARSGLAGHGRAEPTS